MISIRNLVQAIDSEAPDHSAANMREQNETMVFDIKYPDGTPYSMTVADLNLLETKILGGTLDDTSTPDNGGPRANGGLGRKLPLYHPIRKGFYATGRPQLLGAGVPFSVPNEPSDPRLAPSFLSTTLLYPEYRITVDFCPRLYNVWPDSYMSNYNGQWFDFDGNQQTFEYVDEWMRFTDAEQRPKDDWISYTLGGQMAFKATAGTDPSNVNGQPYAQMPRIRMPNSTLKITWYQVPYRYILSPNSYLEKYKGTINQNNWWRWKAGQLLFINYNPTRFQQPNPNKVYQYSMNPTVGSSNRIRTPGTTIGDPGIIPEKYPNPSIAQTCDIELDFVLTNRQLQDGENATTSNPNSVIGGHNLLPWGQDRKFHYAEVTTFDGSNPQFTGISSWKSSPFEILFSDPDYVQNGV